MFNNESDSFYRLVAHSFVCKFVSSNVRQKETRFEIIWLLMTSGAWLMAALMRRLRAVLVWQTLELPLRILQHDLERRLITAIRHLFLKTFICFSWSTRLESVAVCIDDKSTFCLRMNCASLSACHSATEVHCSRKVICLCPSLYLMLTPTRPV